MLLVVFETAPLRVDTVIVLSSLSTAVATTIATVTVADFETRRCVSWKECA